MAAALKGRFNAPAIIGVDGWTGAGKTRLAKELAAAANGSMFDVDTALVRDQKSFVPALRMDAIREALAEPINLLFVSGICLRKVLELAGCAAVAHIYIKRMASWGWADGDELAGYHIPELPGASGEVTRREMRPYHQQWQPHLRADYEFQRFG